MTDPVAVSARLRPVRAGMVAIHCSEPAIRAAVDEFLAARFGGAAVEGIALPGGPWWLAAIASTSSSRVKRILTGDFREMRGHVQALVRRQGIRHAVLIAHQGCTWYEQLHPRLTAGQLIREQGNDLLAAREEIARWAGDGVAVEGHILTLDGEGAVVFRPVF